MTRRIDTIMVAFRDTSPNQDCYESSSSDSAGAVTAPLGPLVQMSVGDEWWKIGQDESGTTKTALLIHAGEWYARALPNLPEGLRTLFKAERVEVRYRLWEFITKNFRSKVGVTVLKPVT